jgi:pyruvate dehydrogenase E2 component (dihydrolipoamide acetyltransferase)
VASEFKLPELGENIHAGDVVRIAVTAGENIKEGQTVLELETDKAVVEVPSTVSGVIESILVAPSQQVKVGDVVFTYSAAEAAAEPPKEPEAPAKTKAAARATAPASAATIAEFRLPELGENIEAGDVVRVAVAAGEELSEGQTVLELETDKAVVEVPSTISGTVQEVNVKTGERIKVGDLVLTVAADGAPAKPAAELATELATQPAEQAPAAEPEHTSDQSYMAMARHSFRSARTAEGKSEEQAFPPDAPPEIEYAQHPAGLAKHAGPEHRPVPAAPIVRKLARDIGVDIYLVKGTGAGGRISEADVKAFAKGVFARMADEGAQLQVAPGASAAAVVKLPDFSRWGAVEKVSLRGVRRKTAEHLALAWNVIPHVTQHDKADVTELEELRKRFAPKAEKAGGKMTMTAIALKVVASALKAFPQFNSSIDTAREEIVYKRYVNIGVAVDTDRGLLVPVIRNVDKKNIIELAVELASASAKAREKKLTAEDMEGGSFTITNLGGIGGTAFTPIVNHPEVAILGMSRSRFEPVWMNNKFEPRMMLPLSLSYDHRIIDGADAARFTRWIVDALEQPFLLSVQG